MLPDTARRVPENTAEDVNRRIEAETLERIRYYAARPALIDRRLAELDAEWDTQRTLEANAASLVLAGTLLGATHDRRWLLLPAAVSAILLQHALQGWCPPLPVLRHLGVRTQREIGIERNALKSLRGDFEDMRRAPPPTRAAAGLAAAET
jgi:hypothetical protein